MRNDIETKILLNFQRNPIKNRMSIIKDSQEYLGLSFLVTSLPFLLLSFIFDVFILNNSIYILFLSFGFLCFLIGTVLIYCRPIKNEKGGE